MNLGAVIFDNKGTYDTKKEVLVLNNAWACVAGQMARRLNTVAELTNDTQWLTNLDFDTYSKFNLRNQANLRKSDYLRVSCDQLLAELGLIEMDNQDNRGVSKIAVESLALIAARVLSESQKRFNVDPRAQKLVDDYVRCFKIPYPQITEKMMTAVASIAQHTFTDCIRDHNVRNKNPTMTLSRNRVIHAKELLSIPVPPDVGWAFMKTDNLDKITVPFIAKVRLEDINPMVSDIVSPSGGAKVAREYITSLEYEVLKRYCKIRVSHVFVCDGHDPAQSPLLEHLPQTAFAECSITNGIIAENLWLAPCQAFTVKGEKRFSAAAAFYRSADRMILMELAIQLAARGLHVRSYGLGSIQVEVPEGQISRVINVASDYRLLPPRSMVFKNVIENRLSGKNNEIKPLDPNASHVDTVDHFLRMKANYKTALNCDAVAISGLDDDKIRQNFLAALKGKPLEELPEIAHVAP